MDFRVEQSHSSFTAVHPRKLHSPTWHRYFVKYMIIEKKLLRKCLWPLFSLNTTIYIAFILRDAGIKVTITSLTAGFSLH
jgi:hypothetical protein